MKFEELLRKISPKLKRITYKLNGHFSSFNHEDLYQEALLHLWLNLREGKLSDKTESYILQGCYFHLKNFLRKNYDKAKLTNLDNLVNQEGEETKLENILPLSSPESTFELAHCKMLIEAIRNNGLTPREKQVFNLSLEGLTTREMGDRLGISHVRVVKLRKKVQEKCLNHMDLL